MDTLTHIVLGACIGEATAGKALGRRALVAGALSQSLPDIDFIAYFWLDQTDNLLAHRGITHSFLFGAVAIIAFSAATKRIFHKRSFTWRQGFWLFGLNIFCHLFIDSFNAYGVGWFEPFDHTRMSFHVLFVADPFFSVWPFFAMLLILFRYRAERMKRIASVAGISLSLLYLFYAMVNKLAVEKEVRRELAVRHTGYQQFFTTPSPFNSWLWFVIIKDQNGFYTGYRSVFDKKMMDLAYSPRNDSLLLRVKDQRDVKNLLRFAQGYYTFENRNDTVVFNILRFGKIAGWHEMDAKFAFYYFFDSPGANEFLVQRGRFKNWNSETVRTFANRIRGN